LFLSDKLDLFIQPENMEQDIVIVAFIIGALYFVINIYNDFLRGICQALLKPFGVLVVSLLSKVISISLIVSLLFLDFGLLSIPIGLFSGALVALLLNILLVKRSMSMIDGKFRVSYRVIRECFNMTPALFGARVGSTIFAKSPYILITYFSNPSLTALYTILIKVGELLLQIVRIAINALVPAMSHLSGESMDKAVSLIKRNLALLMLIITFLYAAYIALNQGFINLWVPTADMTVLDNLPSTIFLFGTGMLVFAMNEVCRSMLYSLGEFKYTSIIMFVMSIFFLLGMFLLLPKLGLQGIAYSLISSSTLGLTLLAIKMHKLKLLDLKLISRSAPLSIMSIAICGLLMEAFISNSGWFDFILKSSVLLVVFFLSFAAYSYEDLRHILKKRL
jgi:O-antigen/teichoic acid export membrane protein